jgi:hypothetical protein
MVVTNANCRFWQCRSGRRGGHAHKEDSFRFRLTFAFTAGLAVVTVVAHMDRAMADRTTVVYPEQASKCDWTRTFTVGSTKT